MFVVYLGIGATYFISVLFLIYKESEGEDVREAGQGERGGDVRGRVPAGRGLGVGAGEMKTRYEGKSRWIVFVVNILAW